MRSTSNNFFSNPLGKHFTVEFYKRFKKKIKNDEFLDCTGSSQKLVEGIRTKTISVQIHLRWDFNETGTDEVPKLYVRLRSKIYENVQVLWSLLKKMNYHSLHFWMFLVHYTYISVEERSVKKPIFILGSESELKKKYVCELTIWTIRKWNFNNGIYFWMKLTNYKFI